jgi:hypothetical protein
MIRANPASIIDGGIGQLLVTVVDSSGRSWI